VQAGVQGRLDWRLHNLAEDPEAVAPADLVVLHRVVCCYPDYARLLGAAADRARRALVFSYPPRNAVSRAFLGVFNLVMRLTGSRFRSFAHPPGAMLACWRIVGFGGPSSATAGSGRSPAWSAFRKARYRSNGDRAGEVGVPTGQFRRNRDKEPPPTAASATWPTACRDGF
jgi:magnesium-protoporphyrin O-methyltransferase